MATMLGYGWLAIEFRMAMFAIALCLPIGAVFVMLQASALSIGLVNILSAAIFIYSLAAFGLTGLAMLQLGSAAFAENETWEDAVDQQRIALEPTAAPAQAPPIELAPVPLDPPKASTRIKHSTIPEKPINKPPPRSSDN